MVSVMQCDEFRSLGLAAIAPVLDRQFESDLHSRRSVIGIENAVESLWNRLHQTLGELHCGRVRASREDDLFDFSRLRRHRFIQLRMRMPVNIYPPRGNPIVKFSPVL